MSTRLIMEYTSRVLFEIREEGVTVAGFQTWSTRNSQAERLKKIRVAYNLSYQYRFSRPK